MSPGRESRGELRHLMTQTSQQIVELMMIAMADGGSARWVIVVKECPGELAAVMLCERATALRDPPREMRTEQFEMLSAEPKEEEILVLLFAKTAAGVGRITKDQAARFIERGRH